MGRLSGFRYREVVQKLRSFGFEFKRQGKGSHEIWYNRKSQVAVVVPRHATPLSEGTLRSILDSAKIDVDAFLDA
ncbi:MAG: type II toxin-antitoxin system HicA family toxin [Candidatus Hydrogenedentes bacterium]|nr:type II toxin-antitoxin system HicA family toxin [Candidatus Hydrogenedentota bacterium]